MAVYQSIDLCLLPQKFTLLSTYISTHNLLVIKNHGMRPHQYHALDQKLGFHCEAATEALHPGLQGYLT